MKQRLDALLVERGEASGRDRAKALVMAGVVYVNGRRADKAGEPVEPDCELEVRAPAIPFVSRGGLKLQKAVEQFGLRLDGKVCADIGASTGGFTDCMLQSGAARVYAVDVGYGQLAWSLRSDERVVVLERTNARYLSRKEIPEPLDFFSADVSFISLHLIFPALTPLLRAGAQGVCLVKPQFEAGREKVGKRGVVRDPAVHREVIAGVAGFAAQSGFSVCGLDFSPVTGPQGNIEYLMLLEYSPKGAGVAAEQIAAVVEAAHGELQVKE